MTLSFPSPEFDDAVAAVCHGTATEEEMRALNDLLRGDRTAAAEYLLRVELHTRLASEPDLFPKPEEGAFISATPEIKSSASSHLRPPNTMGPAVGKTLWRALALAACLAVIAGGTRVIWSRHSANGPTNRPVVLAESSARAPTNQPADDWMPSTSVQPGKQFPQVNSEGRVRTRIEAPGATNVLLDIGAVKYPLTKAADGAWVGESQPQDEGFHYYQLWVDGAQVPDPNSLYFYGAYRWGSGVEVPAKDQDFYALKNVPHGQLRDVLYTANSTGAVRRIFVYTPPDYDKDPDKRYPVLYLQPGAGEDETSWGNQGRVNLILDNLVAEGKAKPFIVVMENAGGSGGPRDWRGGPPANGTVPALLDGADSAAHRPPRGRGGIGFNFSGFEYIVMDDLIPYIDTRYRTIPDQAHRAIAGLSTGGMQARSIALAHLDTFAYIGMFSGGSITTNEIVDMEAFKEKVKLVFVSYGSHEVTGGRGMGVNGKADVEALKAAGINSHYYESPLTAHEWQSWRRSLHEFAPLLFQN